MKHAAMGLASFGRGGDNTLVHMSPSEVHGLQQLAMAGGTSLTINPHTGLPEAFKLKSLLPMLAGIAATFFSGGTLLAPMLAGAATGALTGDKKQSLLMRAGLGALSGWGGGGLGSALANAGKSAATTALTSTGSSLLPGGLTGSVVNPILDTAATTASTGTGVVAPTLAKGAGAFSANLASAGQGLKSIIANPTTVGANAFKDLGMSRAFAAASPLLIASPPSLKGSKEVSPEYSVTTYDPGKVNPNWGKAGNTEPYFIGQKYGPTTLTKQNPYAPSYSSYDKKGNPVGAPGMSPNDMAIMLAKQQQEAADNAGQGQTFNAAEGGAVPSQSPLQSYFDKVNAMRPATIQQAAPPSAAPTAPATPVSGIPANIDPAMFANLRGMSMGGMGMGMGGYGNYGAMARTPKYNAATRSYSYADGGGVDSLGGYSDGGRMVRGPGDGVSDDVPATIHRDDGSKQEARLADGEFVFPARIVSEIGNGSTEAGAQKLYAIMDRIQKGRRATLKNVAADTNAERYFEGVA